MKLIAAGNFEPDGTMYQGCDGPVAPIGIERVQRVGVGTFHFHFSVNTRRDGTHKYRWFVVSRDGTETAEIEWVKPKMAIIKFYSNLTKQLQDLNNGIHFTIVQDDEDGDDDAFVVVASFNPNGTLNTSVPHPLGNFAPRGVIVGSNNEGGRTNILLSTDVGNGSCSWFAWYTTADREPHLYAGMSQGGGFDLWPDHSILRRVSVSWQTADQTQQSPEGIWHLALCRFGIPNPTELRFLSGNEPPTDVAVGVPFAAYAEAKQEGVWVGVDARVSHAASPIFTWNPDPLGYWTANEAGTGTITLNLYGLSITTPPIAAA